MNPLVHTLTKLLLSIVIIIIVALFVAPRTLIAPHEYDSDSRFNNVATTTSKNSDATPTLNGSSEQTIGRAPEVAQSDSLPVESRETVITSPTPPPPKKVAETLVNLEDRAVQELISILRSTSTVSKAPPPSSTATISFDAVNRAVRESLVNILCLANEAGSLGSISATGIIIEKRGVVLTNAHIGQHFLLSHGPEALTECTLRVGSPARSRYRAELLFLPARWIEEHPDNLREENPKGTGENDYALLIITAPTDPETPLPDSYPAISPQLPYSALSGEQLLVAGYAAGFLGGISIQKDLYIVSSIATMNELYSYDGVTPEFLEINGNIAAQRGSSGGAVVNQKQELVGLVSTVTTGTTTNDRLLGAITPTHIDRSMRLNGLPSLDAVLNGSAETQLDDYRRDTVPSLEHILRESLSTITDSP